MPSTNFNCVSGDHQDFRGDNHDQQRIKNDFAKWTHDRVPACTECYTMGRYHGSPMKTVLRGSRGCSYRRVYPTSGNFNKMNLNRPTKMSLPITRINAIADAKIGLQLAKSMPSSVLVNTLTYTPPTLASSDVVAPLCDTDLVDGPVRSLPLSAFVKEPSARATERKVNREYEIVDTNGSTATGRRARDILRQSPTSTPSFDNDFEIV